MELVQAEENRAVADGGAVPRTGAPARCLAGYLLVAAPVMATCAGVLDGPWASGFAYAVLLLGVSFICRAVLPSRPMERVHAEGDRAAADADADADADSHHDVASPDKMKVMARCGYLLVAAPMMGLCAGLLDGPWAAGFAYAALLLGVGFICRAVLPSRPMERVHAEGDRAAADADADADSHHDVASPDKMKVMARCGYLLVAAPMMGLCAGLLDGPWAAGFAYAALLLGVASICRAVLAPRRMERVQARERPAVVDDAGNHQETALPNVGMAWCGYLLVAAPVIGACAGLADTSGAALFGYALLLLGFGLIGLAVLPLRPMGNRPVGNGIRRGDEAVVRATGMDWTGYFVVAAPVVASWAGLVEGPAATFFAFALLLLGIAFLIMAMAAVAKPKMA